MKKNLLAVIILALVLVNLILTAVLVFSIIPQTKKSNELIDQVCAAINIELEGGQNKDSSAVPIEEIAVYNITDNFTVNLADNGDGKKHYAVFSVGLSVNKTSESYATYGGDEMTELTDKETIIRSDINTVVAKYTEEAEVLILDEPTSSLDETTEKYILDGISHYPDKIIFLITHRKENLRYCNKIYQIRDKRMVSVKNVDELSK